MRKKDKATITAARKRIDDYLATLPFEDDERHAEESRAAQKRLLAKLSSPEDREDLFWFLVSFTTALLRGKIVDEFPPNVASSYGRPVILSHLPPLKD